MSRPAAATGADRAAGSGSGRGDRLRRTLLPLAVACGVLTLWQLGVFHRLLGLQPYTLAYPSEMLRALADNADQLRSDVQITMTEAGAGFLIGSSVGFGLALLLSELPGMRRAVLPFVSGLAAMPVIALGPLMVLYFGFGIPSKAAVVVIMTLPPMTVATLKGLTSVDRDLQSLLESYAAGRRDVVRKLRLPYALPFVFTGLKINVTLSLIGAIIAEFFASTHGLGQQMHYALRTFNMPVAWGAMFVAAALGVLWYQLVNVIERRVIPWHSSIRGPA